MAAGVPSLRRAGDSIRMPPFEAFRDAETPITQPSRTKACTGLKHPTPPRSRLRPQGASATKATHRERAASPNWRAAFLCADLELTPELREDHASYISIG